jgi:predicted component of viral defense system (DUF524 family)
VKKASERIDFIDERGTPVACLILYAQSDNINNICRLTDDDAISYGEQPLQITEGQRYEYAFDGVGAECMRLKEAFGKGIIVPSYNPKLLHCGTLIPGLNTGRLSLVATNVSGDILGCASIEVRSVKLSYRNDYRDMLHDITEKCVELLFDLRSAATSSVVPDPGSTPESINQRFSFLRSLIDSRQFRDALSRITTHPHQLWESEVVTCNTRRGFRPDAKTVRQLARVKRRSSLPESHHLAKNISSLPEMISIHRNVQSQDTPENRFVKFALQTFVLFFNKMLQKLNEMNVIADSLLYEEIVLLKNKLDSALTSDMLRNIPEPDMLPLGSMVLQRKEGYREIYQAWIKFDTAARLVWSGGEDVYGAGQRDVATLYEYWVFFKLLDIVNRIFDFKSAPVETLIEKTADGFGLKLKTGKHLTFGGSYLGSSQDLGISFSYNRSFISNSDPKVSGSWSERMRPDYTISIWPFDLTEIEAESQDLMVHVHFDAKYRVDNIEQLFGKNDVDFNEEKQEQYDGRYKRADLLKMHAYNDAIRFTYGAYVLYPGDISKQWRQYKETLPSIGAFPLRPGIGDDKIEKFILEIVIHVSNLFSSKMTHNHMN